MSNIKTSKVRLEENKIKKYAQKSIINKFLLEVMGSFSLIFIINFFISLGEANIPVLWAFNNVVFVTGFWIASWTFIFFLFFEKTGVASNALTLVIDFRNKNINFKQYMLLIVSQLLGGILASFLTFGIVQGLIVNNVSGLKNIHVMGGTIPYIKGLFTSKGHVAWNPVDFRLGQESISQWGFAPIQGLINASIIIFSFFSLKAVEKKYNIGITSKIIRYLMLVSLVSSSVILTSNTTNYNRLLSPAIIDLIFNQGHVAATKLFTTMIFISAQSIGLLVVYYSGIFDKNEEVLSQLKGEQDGI